MGKIKENLFLKNQEKYAIICSVGTNLLIFIAFNVMFPSNL